MFSVTNFFSSLKKSTQEVKSSTKVMADQQEDQTHQVSPGSTEPTDVPTTTPSSTTELSEETTQQQAPVSDEAAASKTTDMNAKSEEGKDSLDVGQENEKPSETVVADEDSTTKPAAEESKQPESQQKETKDEIKSEAAPHNVKAANHKSEKPDKKDSTKVVIDSKAGEVSSSTGGPTGGTLATPTVGAPNTRSTGDLNKSATRRQTGRNQKSSGNYRRPANKTQYTRRFVGYYQVQSSYGIKSPPYKSNFEPSETARQKADEFLKMIRQQQ